MKKRIPGLLLAFVLLVCLLGLVISLLMKPATGSRRYSHVPVLLALIAMIAASAYFPVTLVNAGSFAVDQIREQRQRFTVEETALPEDAEAVETDAPLP